jgi:hypothetical protein
MFLRSETVAAPKVMRRSSVLLPEASHMRSFAVYALLLNEGAKSSGVRVRLSSCCSGAKPLSATGLANRDD